MNGKKNYWSFKRICLYIAAFVIFLLVVTNVFTVPAGEVGVAFNPFSSYSAYDPTTNMQVKSSVSPDEYREGIHVKFPWVKVTMYNARTQDYTMSVIAEEGQQDRDDRIRTVTSEGLYIGLDITVLYRLNSVRADEVRRSIGVDGEYQQILVRPAIRSVIREVVSRYEAADVYGEGRKLVQDTIFSELEVMLSPRGVTVESILLRDVELPEEITAAIEAKKAAEQEAQRMEYVLQKELLEKQRKLIEAEGIAAANKEISGSLTTQYLSWYWISTIDDDDVIYMIPSEGGGLPVFKNIP